MYSPEEQHHGKFSNLFHHNTHNEHGEKSDKTEEHSGTKKESEKNKLEGDLKTEAKKVENYIRKDEELEEEGKTYGGLM